MENDVAGTIWRKEKSAIGEASHSISGFLYQSSNLRPAISGMGGAIGDTGDAIGGMGDAIGGRDDAIGDTGSAIGHLRPAIDGVSDAIGHLRPAIDGVGVAIDDLCPAIPGMGAASGKREPEGLETKVQPCLFFYGTRCNSRFLPLADRALQRRRPLQQLRTWPTLPRETDT